MKNDKIMRKSIDFCMKFVKNRSESVISNPDTDLIIIYFCCLVSSNLGHLGAVFQGEDRDAAEGRVLLTAGPIILPN